jgi:hypothetical protein
MSDPPIAALHLPLSESEVAEVTASLESTASFTAPLYSREADRLLAL